MEKILRAPINLFICLSLICISNVSFGQSTIQLYPEGIPNSIQAVDEEVEKENQWVFKVSKPTLTIFKAPENIANGTSIIICPGGGYGALNMNMEGYAIAKKLNSMGVTAFVLKYRLPDDKHMKDKSIGPIQDAQKAIQLVRENAKQWNVDPNRVGIMGFSAGGHLAATAGTHFDKSYLPNKGNTNLRPDFMVLVYPVISFKDSLVHWGSRENLIGKNADDKKVDLFSTEKQITSKTPPAFLIHASDDGLVTVKNSTSFYLAMLASKAACGLHIFPVGEHGFPKEPAHTEWFNYCTQWLKENKWVR